MRQRVKGIRAGKGEVTERVKCVVVGGRKVKKRGELCVLATSRCWMVSPTKKKEQHVGGLTFR